MDRKEKHQQVEEKGFFVLNSSCSLLVWNGLLQYLSSIPQGLCLYFSSNLYSNSVICVYTRPSFLSISLAQLQQGKMNLCGGFVSLHVLPLLIKASVALLNSVFVSSSVSVRGK